MTGYTEMMMRLITDSGMRVDRPLTDLDKLLTLAKRTPYAQMNQVAKLRIKLLLHIEHQERERRRFAPIN